MKFKTLDERYLNLRCSLSEKCGPRELWSVIDQWPLYVGTSNLARFMVIGDMLRETLEVPGHIVEFGSWRGANLMFMAKILRIYDPHGCKEVHCFEGFSGLETFSAQDGGAAESEGGSYR
jgi:hypothetical protein